MPETLLHKDPPRLARAVPPKRLLRELEAYSPLLARKPVCFILSKSDLLKKDTAPAVPSDWFHLSAVTGEGLREIVFTLMAMIDAATAGPSSALGGTAIS